MVSKMENNENMTKNCSNLDMTQIHVFIHFEVSAIETKKSSKDKYGWVHKFMSSWQYSILGYKTLQRGGHYLDT